MPENRQRRQRLDAWRQELNRQVMIPLARVAFSGCAAPERLSPREAEALPFEAMPVGAAWGLRREYRWFSAWIDLPREAAGQRLELVSGVGGEQLVYLEGRALGSIDRHHPSVTLFRAAPGSGRFRLLIESYAGHGPCPPERAPIPPVTGPQCRVGESWLMRVNEDAYQLRMDVETLAGLLERLPEGSLRRMKVEAALDAFTHIADFELPLAERTASFAAARAALREALACRNGDTAPVLRVIGQSHIDLAWLWPMEETFHKAVRTFANQLALMDEYPEYRFLACEPALLEMLEARDGGVFARLMDKVRAGQVRPEGAFYVEADTNIPSGESLIRQLMWGKRWFREKMGVESLVAWQPDTFGFTACLPQLLRGFGIPYFATQKLLRADPECERFPYQDFIWEGADGSRVQALSFFKNNARTDPQSLSDRWLEHRSQQEGIDSLLFPFGYGDGGGGADRDMLEYLRRETDLEGLPRTEWSDLAEHFRRSASAAEKNVWRGELYLAWHRGTYTAQRRTKQALFALEQALHDTEFLLASCGERERQEGLKLLKSAWRTLLIHQFHDIAAGVGIRDVHEEAVRALTAAREQTEALSRRLMADVCRVKPAEGAVTVLNTLSFPRKVWLSLPGGAEGYLSLPAGGAVTARAEDLLPPVGLVRVDETPEGWRVENGVLAFTLTREGTIADLTDLRSGLPLQDGGMRMNDLRLYKNVEPVYDAWELSRDYPRDFLPGAVRVEDIRLTGADTPCLAADIRMKIGGSAGYQTVTVRAGEDQIDFSLRVDWQERHRLLRARFESNLRCDSALFGMQFCHVSRPAHRATAFARDRYEVCHHGWSALFETGRGFALLDRAIYGGSAEDGALSLSLLRAPLVPDDTCDRGPQHFAWALKIYPAPFALCDVAGDAAAFRTPPLLLPGAGFAPEGYRAENAMLETIKPAEDGTGVILRLWEPRGTRTRATLRLPAPGRVLDCGPDERGTTLLSRTDRCDLELRPFEIRTLKVVEQGEG